ncbi:hypothetical protein HK105_201108 [Polyrhizophydium stewartii]|uniref:BD-FAE-like domain-containing protein n=1 Tax=Polyrhizophydium stewartii TaxID=2732419 RepID=A0ABR4NIU9_9FUNG|nr:hypothetical protein HK105_002876 [Polyrhizophydium stewartii]
MTSSSGRHASYGAQKSAAAVPTTTAAAAAASAVRSAFSAYVDVSERTIFHLGSRLRGMKLNRFQKLFLAAALVVSPLLAHLLLPFWLLLLAMPYLLAWYLYLAYAQLKNPKRRRFLGILWPYLPIDPVRIFQVNYAFWDFVDQYATGPPREVAFKLYQDMWRQKRLRGGPKISLNVDYGGKNGTRLDIYGTDVNRPNHVAYLSEKENRRPVVIFFYGGGWTSGDKSLYSPISKTLAARGYVTVIPDYSLWPRGTPEDMLHDVRKVIEWTHAHVRAYGGDPANINLIAHSAGAHLCVLVMIRNAMRLSEACLNSRLASLSPDRIDPLCEAEVAASEDVLHKVHGMIMISGPFDIADHLEFESLRGVEEISCMARLFGHNEHSFAEASPTRLLQQCRRYIEAGEFARHLPHNWLLLHGHRDQVVPFSSSLKLFEALDKSGIDHIVLKTYEEPDHAKLIFDLMLPEREHSSDFDVELCDFFARCRKVARYKRWLSASRKAREAGAVFGAAGGLDAAAMDDDAAGTAAAGSLAHPSFKEFEESLEEQAASAAADPAGSYGREKRLMR